MRFRSFSSVNWIFCNGELATNFFICPLSDVTFDDFFESPVLEVKVEGSSWVPPVIEVYSEGSSWVPVITVICFKMS